jgi:hypothetical protein
LLPTSDMGSEKLPPALASAGHGPGYDDDRSV